MANSDLAARKFGLAASYISRAKAAVHHSSCLSQIPALLPGNTTLHARHNRKPYLVDVVGARLLYMRLAQLLPRLPQRRLLVFSAARPITRRSAVGSRDGGPLRRAVADGPVLGDVLLEVDCEDDDEVHLAGGLVAQHIPEVM